MSIKYKYLYSRASYLFTMDNKVEQFQRYLEIESDYSKSTIRQYLWAMHSFARDLNSQEDIEDFIAKKVYQRTNNPFYKGFLKAYIDCFKLPYTLPKSKRKKSKQHKEYKFLTKDQVMLIINNSTPWVSLLTRLFFETGLRLTELVDIERKGIDLVDGTLSGKGKGGKDFNLSISRKSIGLLAQYIHNDYICPLHKDISNKNHARSYAYHLGKEAKKLGIENVHPHRLRHALGHHLRVDKKFDLKQIQRLLRHSRLETTGIYTEATEQEVMDKMRKEVFEE